MSFSRQPLRNEFSWSKSRHEKFTECPRNYYLHYYASWGGWERRAPAEVRELYLLKKLTFRQAWAGTTVHDGIKRALMAARDGVEIGADELIARLRAKMRAEFRESREKRYRLRKAFGLWEHEYEAEVRDAEWKSNWELVERCIQAFFGSRWWEIARSLPKADWLPIDELGSFQFEGTKIFAAPDFAFRQGDALTVVDWKTGRPRPSDREQLLGYALYARDNWGAALSAIDCRVVYLPSMDETEVRPEEEAVAPFVDHMRASIERMKEVLVDPEENVAIEANFPRTDDERACARCVFRRPCRGDEPRELEAG